MDKIDLPYGGHFYTKGVDPHKVQRVYSDGESSSYQKIGDEICQIVKVESYAFIPVPKWEEGDWGTNSDKSEKLITKKYNEAFDLITNEGSDFVKCTIKIKEFLECAKQHCSDTFERDGVYYANKLLCGLLGIEPDVMLNNYFDNYFD